MLRVARLINTLQQCRDRCRISRSFHNDPYQGKLIGSTDPPPICKGRNMEEKEKPECCPLHKPQDCTEEPIDPCGPTKSMLTNLMCCTHRDIPAIPCTPKKGEKTEEQPQGEPPQKSMWEVPPDFKRTCETEERYDEKYYKTSDKLKRVYTQTWISCEPVVRRRISVCCFDDEPPKCVSSVKRTSTVKYACEADAEKLKINFDLLKKCMAKPTVPPKWEKKCLKIVMPCCPPVRDNVRCIPIREAKKCAKECTPYPCFAECLKDALRKPPPRECGCLQTPISCEVQQYLAIKQKFNLPPNVPAWPPERPK